MTPVDIIYPAIYYCCPEYYWLSFRLPDSAYCAGYFAALSAAKAVPVALSAAEAVQAPVFVSAFVFEPGSESALSA